MTTQDIFEGSHFEFSAGESYISSSDRAWDRWTAKVERLLGHDLDGNQERDGYCIDSAYEAFADGLTPAQYVEEVRDEQAHRT